MGLPTVPIEDQIACVEREIKMREHVYQTRIERGLMSVPLASRELKRMRAVLETLMKLKPDLRAQQGFNLDEENG